MSPGDAKVLVGRVYWSASLGAPRSWEGSEEEVLDGSRAQRPLGWALQGGWFSVQDLCGLGTHLHSML